MIYCTQTKNEESDLNMKKDESISLIKSFIHEKLDGNIWNFMDFNLALLENDKKYGGNDPDNSKIANAVYVALWGDKIQNLSFDQMGKTYRGDTLNSFHTLMGFPTEDFSGFTGIQKYTTNVDIINMAKEYHKKYHTIGNMMLWPNHSIKISGKQFTINTIRSKKPWYDYFDSFLVKLKEELNNPILSSNIPFSDLVVRELIKEDQNFFEQYFQIGSLHKFENFIHTFYLEDYIDTTTYEIPQIFSPHAYHWNETYTTEEYETYVTSYITKATEIIEARCSRMIKDLEIIIKNNTSPQKNISHSSARHTNKTSNVYRIKERLDGKVPYILLNITFLTQCLYIVGVYIHFLITTGYDGISLEIIGGLNNLYNHNFIDELLLNMVLLAILFMGFSYRKKHTGIRRLLITLFLIFESIAIAIPILSNFIYSIIQRNYWLISTFPRETNFLGLLMNVGDQICYLFLIISIIISSCLFLLEKEYRIFMKRCGIIILILCSSRIIFDILSYKIGAILGCITIAVLFLMKMYLAISFRCPSCKKLHGLQYTNRQLIKEEPISIKVINEQKNINEKVIGTYEQYIPGYRRTYVNIYTCQKCGYIHKKTVIEDVKAV